MLSASFIRTVHGRRVPLHELIKDIDFCRQSSVYVSSASFPIIPKEYINGILCRHQITLKHEDASPNIKLH